MSGMRQTTLPFQKRKAARVPAGSHDAQPKRRRAASMQARSKMKRTASRARPGAKSQAKARTLRKRSPHASPRRKSSRLQALGSPPKRKRRSPQRKKPSKGASKKRGRSQNDQSPRRPTQLSRAIAASQALRDAAAAWDTTSNGPDAPDAPVPMEFDLPAELHAQRMQERYLLELCCDVPEEPVEFKLPRSLRKMIRKDKTPKFKQVRSNSKTVVSWNTPPNQKCGCDPQAGRCGRSCLNRVLQVECTKATCNLENEDKCTNRCFRRHKWGKVKPVRTLLKGWGLFSGKSYGAGKFLAEYVGEIITNKECHKRIARMLKKGGTQCYYFLTVEDDVIIDARSKGSIARFLNHSCDPNCEVQKWNVGRELRIGIFTTRPVGKGEELTIDYQYDRVSNAKRQPCFCGTDKCSGFIGGSLDEDDDDKGKKARKKKKKCKYSTVLSDDECLYCGDGGSLVLCSKREKSGWPCRRSYHVKCMPGMTSIPTRQWYCPWHYCDVCGRSVDVGCFRCTDSWCMEHAPQYALDALKKRRDAAIQEEMKEMEDESDDSSDDDDTDEDEQANTASGRSDDEDEEEEDSDEDSGSESDSTSSSDDSSADHSSVPSDNEHAAGSSSSSSSSSGSTRDKQKDMEYHGDPQCIVCSGCAVEMQETDEPNNCARYTAPPFRAGLPPEQPLPKYR